MPCVIGDHRVGLGQLLLEAVVVAAVAAAADGSAVVAAADPTEASWKKLLRMRKVPG